MNNKQIKEENGKKIKVIKTPGYYLILFFGIAIILFFIIMMLKNRDSISGGIPFLAFFIILFINAIKKIHIYEKCFIFGDRIIKYKDIASIEFIKKEYNDAAAPLQARRDYTMTGKFSNERFLRVNLKNNEVPFEFLAANYSTKQMKQLIKYVEKYSSCDLKNSYAFLEQAEKAEKKDLIISAILFCALIIGLVLVIKFYFMPMAEKY